jgi:hypothetical protein
MIRDRTVLEKIKLFETGVTVLENVLSSEEVKWLLDWFTQLRKDEANNRSRASDIRTSRKNYLTIINDDNLPTFSNMITPKLNLQDFIYESVNFYKIEKPYHLHSDTGKDNTVVLKQGVIPLEVNPNNIDTYTVIFDQKVYFSSEYIHPLFKKEPTYQPFYNIGTWDPSYYEGWSDEYKISDEMGSMIWYDKWPYWKEVYKGFSIKHVFKWKVGDILLFDRSLLHASSLLDIAGIDHKIGILFLTEHMLGKNGIK